MSQHKGNHIKHTRHASQVGEMPNANLKGVIAAAESIKDKFRSPFGFCGPKRSNGRQV